jgi:hypothetical protein
MNRILFMEQDFHGDNDENIEKDPVHIENQHLKQIIREYDLRIFYLEKKLNLATEYVNYLEEKLPQYRSHANICHYCKNTYLHDEIVCDCNIFCGRSLCKDCYSELMKNREEHIYMCQNRQCKTWSCSTTSTINQCKSCDKQFCGIHYHNANIDIQNWICISCCEKAKTEYGYESV